MCYMRSSQLNKERPAGSTKGGWEVGEIVAFRYLKDFEQRERLLTHAKRQIKTTWQKLEGNLILFHYRE